MFELLTKLVAAYLIGGVMGGDVLRAVLGGEDLRRTGSGNVGATNALRNRSKGFALGVLAIDISKGVLAAALIPRLDWPWAGHSMLPMTALAYACGAAVVLGHCYPLLQKFRGGKGVATLTGVCGALLPWALPWMLLAFVLTLLIGGYVSLASLLAAATAVLWVVVDMSAGLLSPAGAFVLAMLVLLLVKHRENIQRLARGEERRFERARVIGRRLDRWRGR